MSVIWWHVDKRFAVFMLPKLSLYLPAVLNLGVEVDIFYL